MGYVGAHDLTITKARIARQGAVCAHLVITAGLRESHSRMT
jgi:hypothetical protein